MSALDDLIASRSIRIEGDIAYVPLTQGYEATIDATDVPLVEGRNWYALVRRRRDGTIRAVYAVRGDWREGKQHIIRMHRLIAGTPDSLETDHRDGDGLNNRRFNLRPATKAQNMHNRRIGTDNTSGAKGVCWAPRKQRWHARIWLNGKCKSLGRHATIEAAAAAYAAAASARLHEDFGRTA